MDLSKLFFSGGLFKKPKKKKSYVSAPDTSRSISYGQVIELLCSGGKYGIEGLKDDGTGQIDRACYLDETPLRNENGTTNFEGIQIYQRKGAPGQTAISEFNSEIVSEIGVGVEVKANTPVIRAFVNSNITAVRLRLSFVLYKNVLDGGNVIGTEANSVQFNVYIQEGGGAYVLRETVTVTGKYSEPYEKIWFYTVDPAQDTFYIRVERVTIADDDDNKRLIQWESYSIITETILPFKRCALVANSFNAEDFGENLPERKYRINGMLLDIPTNATIQSDGGLLFSGNWDGLFKAELVTACSDFGAIIWYLLTDEIDGAGDEVKAYMIDRYSLFKMSEYNNELIPDGYGGTERRFLFNGVINKQTDSWKLIEEILSGCNTRYVWENNTIKFIQDRPEEPIATISNADVIDGIFDYSTTELNEIATAVSVTWIEPVTGKTRNTYFSDPKAIAKYGFNLKEVEAVGCNRLSQALRLAKAIIYNESLETEVVTTSTRNWVAYIPIGSVVIISDNGLHNKRQSGIIRANTTTTEIFLDYPIQIDTVSGFDEQFYLLLYPDVRESIRVGTTSSAYDHYVTYGQGEGRHPNGYLIGCILNSMTMELRYVTNPPGVYNSLTVETAFSSVPPTNSTFLVISPDIPVKMYRLEAKDIDDGNPDVLNLTFKQYDPYKWDKIERDLNLGTKRAQVIKPVKPLPPTNFTYTVYSNSGIHTVEISWQAPLNSQGVRDTFVVRYFLSWKVSTENTYSLEEQLEINTYTFTTTATGTYNFRVQAETFNELESDYLIADVIVS